MTENSTDPQKKYWFVIFIIVPIVVALIALLPMFLNEKKETSPTKTNHLAPTIFQKTEEGHNFNDINGDIIINSSPKQNNDK